MAARPESDSARAVAGLLAQERRQRAASPQPPAEALRPVVCCRVPRGSAGARQPGPAATLGRPARTPVLEVRMALALIAEPATARRARAPPPAVAPRPRLVPPLAGT